MKVDVAQQFPRLTLLQTLVTCLFQVVRSCFWLLIEPGQVNVVECESSHLPSPVFTCLCPISRFDAGGENSSKRVAPTLDWRQWRIVRMPQIHTAHAKILAHDNASLKLWHWMALCHTKMHDNALLCHALPCNQQNFQVLQRRLYKRPSNNSILDVE